MIIYHQTHIAAFVGAHIHMWVGQPLFLRIISVTTAPGVGQPFYIRDNYTMPPFLGMSQS